MTREDLLREAVRRATAPGTLERSDAWARQHATVYFVLVLAAIWFGVMGASKEIVTERHVVNREHRAGLGFASILGAKFSSQAAVLGSQTALLTVMTAPWLLELAPHRVGALWLVLWLSGVAAAALGLLISCVTTSYRATLTVVPLIIIPQVLFGGLLRPLRGFAEGRGWLPEILSWFSLQRWGFQASLEMDPYATANVLTFERPDVKTNTVGFGAMIEDAFRARMGGMSEIFFDPKAPAFTHHPVVILAGSVVLLLFLSWLVLARGDNRR